MSSTIGSQTAAYRQGLVLGLTMAEIMLLLVFCLLIAVGVALANERAKLDAAVVRLQKIESAVTAAAADKALAEPIKRNPRLVELVHRAAASGSQREIDQFWRHLVESDDIVVGMERQGIERAALKDQSNALAKLQQMLRNGIDPDKAAKGAALASAIDESATANAAATLTPQQVIALIEKGLSSGSNSSSTGGHNWPPIINLSEAAGYYFAVGSADLTPDFAWELRTVVVDRLLAIAEAFDVDVIEVIGHTDEQAVAPRPSNLDRNLPAVTSGLADALVLQWSDNAGLGLARALAVVKVLSADVRLKNFRILPLSAAQLIGTDGRLTRWDGQGDVRERRRIEIRTRKAT
jgi:outer membrane protein OmpA-like peptidoglycan-associated protein